MTGVATELFRVSENKNITLNGISTPFDLDEEETEDAFNNCKYNIC